MNSEIIIKGNTVGTTEFIHIVRESLTAEDIAPEKYRDNRSSAIDKIVDILSFLFSLPPAVITSPSPSYYSI